MQVQDGSQLVLVTALAQDDARFVIAVAGFNAHSPAITGFGCPVVVEIGRQIPGLLLADIQTARTARAPCPPVRRWRGASNSAHQAEWLRLAWWLPSDHLEI